MAHNFARDERTAVCDTLTALGPDQPTLCAGWTTRDLAAHLVVRERRPDAAAGIRFAPLAGYLARVQATVARQPFDDLVDLVRRPPRLSLAGVSPLDRLVNTTEFFIHLADIDRAQPSWTSRDLPRGLGRALWPPTRILARSRLRGMPTPVVVTAPGYGQVRRRISGGRAGGDQVTLIGDPGELLLFFSGRRQVAQVEMTGPQAGVDWLRSQHFAL